MNARPIRVALVTHYFGSHRGGVESVAGQLASRLGKTGAFSIDWVSSNTTSPPSPLPGLNAIAVRAWNGLERRGFPWPVWGPRGLSRLRRVIMGADIVHIHDFIYFPNIAAYVFARLARKPIERLGGLDGFSPFNLDDFVKSRHSQRKGKGKDDAWLRMEAFGGAEGKLGAAEHALEGAHQVVMADEAKVAILAETESDFIEAHAAWRASMSSGV